MTRTDNTRIFEKSYRNKSQKYGFEKGGNTTSACFLTFL